MSTPYIDLLYDKILSEVPTTTRGLENKYIVSILTQNLSETGELGTLSKEKLTQLEAIKGGIRHDLSSKQDRSLYGNDIIAGVYSPKFNEVLIDLKKKFIGKQARNLDIFFAEGVKGGKRKQKRYPKTKKAKQSRRKKTKSRVRK